ncbi:P-loop containing nucleoside triphosphate hydrolase protein [Mycena amicta]|nr:P-loop containing nucleoside triphosphate hydrolase protein [Mycena amicta]
MQTVKLVVVGDHGVGKVRCWSGKRRRLIQWQTALCISHTTGIFPAHYIPNVLDSCVVTKMVGEDPFTVGLFDVGGSVEYDRLRPLSYPQTDAFIVCFSVRNRTSFENIQSRWFPEIHHHCPKVPFVLVATQTDTRDNIEVVNALAALRQRPISTEQGLRLSREVGAARYVECSALTMKGVNDPFEQAVDAAIESPRFYGNSKKSRCLIL